MTDDVFNTIAAVALMCGSHIVSGGTLDNNMVPLSARYQPGFEACTAVVAAYRYETEERKDKAAKEQEEREKARVLNALAALRGKKFTPEAAPPKQSTSLWNSTCLMPLTGAVNITEGNGVTLYSPPAFNSGK